MKKSAIVIAVFVLMISLTPGLVVRGQEQPADANTKSQPVAATPIKLQIVFAEYDGDKKVKSLPYTIYHNSSHNSILQPDFTKVRIGSRVPVVTGTANGGAQFQYLDVGTNLDCRSVRNNDGKFLVQLSVERSWVEGDTPTHMSNNAPQQSASADSFREPIIRNIRSDQYISLRDGQTVETTAATDPISGRTVRIEVTLNVVK